MAEQQDTNNGQGRKFYSKSGRRVGLLSGAAAVCGAVAVGAVTGGTSILAVGAAAIVGGVSGFAAAKASHMIPVLRKSNKFVNRTAAATIAVAGLIGAGVATSSNAANRGSGGNTISRLPFGGSGQKMMDSSPPPVVTEPPASRTPPAFMPTIEPPVSEAPQTPPAVNTTSDAPAQAQQPVEPAAPVSMTNGQDSIDLRYISLSGRISGRDLTVTFAVFEINPDGTFGRGRAGTINNSGAVRWIEDGQDLLETARIMAGVEKATFLREEPSSYVYLLDNGRVADLNKSTGAVSNFRDPTEAETQLAANGGGGRRYGLVQFAYGNAHMANEFRSAILVDNRKYTVETDNGYELTVGQEGRVRKVIRVNENGDLRLGSLNMDDNSFTPSSESATQDHIDTMRLYINFFKHNQNLNRGNIFRELPPGMSFNPAQELPASSIAFVMPRRERLI